MIKFIRRLVDLDDGTPVPETPPAATESWAEREPNPVSSAPEQLATIARASVHLAQLGPRLAEFAAELEKQAQAQAANAANMAQTMERLTAKLGDAVGELRETAIQVGSALESVEQIADQTRVLALNAGIEAARAGTHGRAFAVIVEEVQRLAGRTRESTTAIDGRIHQMNTSIGQVEEGIVGGGASVACIAAANRDVQGIASGAELQFNSSRALHAMSDRMNDLAETLLLGVGRFRFGVHYRAERQLAELMPDVADACTSRNKLESLLEQWLNENPCFQLVYVTDPAGCQIIDNIGWKDGRTFRDPAGFGRDWSDRPWYCETMHQTGVISTDIYRGAGSDEFCFTVSTPVFDQNDAWLGVLAADVRFERLMAGTSDAFPTTADGVRLYPEGNVC
ncbi:hypothetical protein DB347_17315 [Opitutaceae bacterium EW11]|nr:hypothetical protein DB347_17315 [Opitutaceae bacterium EW11]